MSDIRKWFMKSHDKDAGGRPGNGRPVPGDSARPEVSKPDSEKPAGESAPRRKTSKYFASAEKMKPKDEMDLDEVPNKRIAHNESQQINKPPATKRGRKVKYEDDEDEDFVSPVLNKSADVTPSKKLKTGSGRGVPKKSAEVEASEDEDEKVIDTPVKSGGRGRGGRGSSAAPAGGRGRGGGGRGGFMNYGERKDPPHKGEKEVPEGAPDCLAGLTFVISGTLDSLEREEAEDLIKRHGGRITGSVSKKTNYLLCDEDIGGNKSKKARELGTVFLTEDGLFDMIRSSVRDKAPPKDKSISAELSSPPTKTAEKVVTKSVELEKVTPSKASASGAPLAESKVRFNKGSYLIWTEKYRPIVPNDIIGNPSLVTQLHNWLQHWNEQFLEAGRKGKGKKANDPAAKKAVLLSGSPGIGKTSSAKVVCQMLGFQAIEVNASDSRGKADSKIQKGISGSNANSVKELVSNESLGSSMDRSKHCKSVLIMDEVDGMSAGDRGGIADLIASIKISKIPIICICNDRYSQKLKSLVNYCLQLNFRKPTKQQMAKRLSQVCKAEGLDVQETALETLAERVNGDMRMALNQLQYMSRSMIVIKYDDMKERLVNSAKDEDISPFTAVDEMLGFNGGKLRMDERIDLSMSDPDLVPLIIQENYLNYRPAVAAKDDDGMKRLSLIARAADSIATGDIINVQIRRYRQWQLSQSACLSSCILPAALLHGQRETLGPGERNFNRFGGWLGKNSTMGKNLRILDDLHDHLLASRESNPDSCRGSLRMHYFTLLLKRLTNPLRELPKDEAVVEVVDLMNAYSISQEDFDTIVELSKFQGHPSPLEGIPPAMKAALTRAYNERSKSQMVRAADLVTLPGARKAPKKRIAAILEPPVEGEGEENGEALADSEEEAASDTEVQGTDKTEKQLQFDLEGLNSKAIKVQLDLKGTQKSAAKKAPAGRGKGGTGTSAPKTGGGRGSGSSTAAKRKR
ncbi:hypothetical protein MLD38_019679 [Melastoma candidum]|uniref:Uncharacterized protein n=1 Tax=Melastoma candidum TaxID=119954 RepID=A0ACB9QXZ0_9MYRT|nr:hypothetical protein MLD38_019679 [Melastoma candidum]